MKLGAVLALLPKYRIEKEYRIKNEYGYLSLVRGKHIYTDFVSEDLVITVLTVKSVVIPTIMMFARIEKDLDISEVDGKKIELLKGFYPNIVRSILAWDGQSPYVVDGRNSAEMLVASIGVMVVNKDERWILYAGRP